MDLQQEYLILVIVLIMQIPIVIDLLMKHHSICKNYNFFEKLKLITNTPNTETNIEKLDKYYSDITKKANRNVILGIPIFITVILLIYSNAILALLLTLTYLINNLLSYYKIKI
ncbi:hypothetical protein [Mycoplasma sp. P36-A1]|uniref:hypothetical protein n=1 Tax=Mycoplasma sp. P36-A1 TaxID=3252900 RepID=UPI003C2ADFC1